MNYKRKEVFADADITLYLGDCNLIIPELEERFDAVITDPPYGISYRSNMSERKFEHIVNDERPSAEWMEDLGNIVKYNSCLFLFTRWDVEHVWRDYVSDGGWDIKSQVIWHKESGGMGDLYAQYSPSHENAIFATRGKWHFPSKRPASVYRITRDDVNSYVHPTQKPTALMERIVLDVTDKDASVVDPFMGSGTTGIACAKHKRKFVGIEIDERYFDFACERIANMLMQPRLL